MIMTFSLQFRQKSTNLMRNLFLFHFLVLTFLLFYKINVVEARGVFFCAYFISLVIPVQFLYVVVFVLKIMGYECKMHDDQNHNCYRIIDNRIEIQIRDTAGGQREVQLPWKYYQNWVAFAIVTLNLTLILAGFLMYILSSILQISNLQKVNNFMQISFASNLHFFDQIVILISIFM